MQGFVLGGTHSGVGKTVAALVVSRALERTGERVQPAKAGPDFVDPSHHAHALDRPSRTLDPWLQGTTGLRRNYHRGDGDVCVIEGVMGVYDGDVSSTARVAADLDVPVGLVVDASGGMESVAATALGFRAYTAHSDVDVDVAGVLAQRAHGGRHERGIRDALPDDLAYLGRVPPDDALDVPDRHLGLHMGDEAPIDDDALDAASEHVDVDALLALARTPPHPSTSADQQARTRTDPTVAVARDDAFRFTYPATIERLRERAHVEPFEPTNDDPLPECDAVYLPGGYPELHADALAASSTLDAIHDTAVDGTPVLGECGGLMALAESLTTTDGTTHDMAGVLPARIRMHDRYQALDHVALTATRDTLTATRDTTLHGHEFHYSNAIPDSDARYAFHVDRGTGITDENDGLTEYRTLGTYAHVHAESGAFDAFIDTH